MLFVAAAADEATRDPRGADGGRYAGDKSGDPAADTPWLRLHLHGLLAGRPDRPAEDRVPLVHNGQLSLLSRGLEAPVPSGPGASRRLGRRVAHPAAPPPRRRPGPDARFPAPPGHFRRWRTTLPGRHHGRMVDQAAALRRERAGSPG